MAEVTNELMYEVLKEIQGDLAAMRYTQKDHTQQFLDLKKQTNRLQGQINAVMPKSSGLKKKSSQWTRASAA